MFSYSLKTQEINFHSFVLLFIQSNKPENRSGFYHMSIDVN
jgi:hypothetical protein